MSLPKKLRRFFNEVRKEARRNPAFASRLENALDAIGPEDLVDDDMPEEGVMDGDVAQAGVAVPPTLAVTPASEVNPIAIARREGQDALRAALEGLPEMALRGLIAEHNLDPAGEAAKLRKGALADHIVRQAVKRIERDKKLFEY